jgi:asparagine synthase (glutamine-hydrolysing)
MGEGIPAVTIGVWAAAPDYRLDTAVANGRAAIVIRHPLCQCGGKGSEAERFLRQVEKQPENVFDDLRGEAVLILWNGPDELLRAARAVGSTRPLFFARSGRGLALSDSIDTLFSRGAIEAEFNRELFVCHLADSWHGSDETYFVGVSRVPPAHELRWRDGESSFRLFWDPLPVGRPIEWFEGDVLGQFEALFKQAVARAIGSERAGVFLSGGLDSVSIAAVASDLARSNGADTPLALSLAMPHPDCDERELQAGAADSLELDQFMVGFDEALAGRNLAEAALEMSAGWPAPLQNFWLPAYMRLAEIGGEQGCRVILTGHGGDEWLGVSPFLAADQLKRLQLGRWFRLWRTYDRSYLLSRPHLFRNIAWKFGVRPLLTRRFWNVVRGISPGARPAWRRWRRNRSVPEWVAPDTKLRDALLEREAAACAAEEASVAEDEYTRQCRLPISHMLVALEYDEIAEQGRRSGTLIRQPFFDPDLVSFLSRVKPEDLDRGGRSKGLVRAEVAKRCPDLGFEDQRKAVGGGLFLERMAPEIGSIWRQIGGPRVLAEMGAVDARRVQLVLRTIEEDTNDVRTIHRAWSMLSLECWARAARPISG